MTNRMWTDQLSVSSQSNGCIATVVTRRWLDDSRLLPAPPSLEKEKNPNGRLSLLLLVSD